jgi:hypothetical protein
MSTVRAPEDLAEDDAKWSSGSASQGASACQNEIFQFDGFAELEDL